MRPTLAATIEAFLYRFTRFSAERVEVFRSLSTRVDVDSHPVGARAVGRVQVSDQQTARTRGQCVHAVDDVEQFGIAERVSNFVSFSRSHSKVQQYVPIAIQLDHVVEFCVGDYGQRVRKRVCKFQRQT